MQQTTKYFNEISKTVILNKIITNKMQLVFDN